MQRQRPNFLQTLIRSEPGRVVQLGLGVLLILLAPIAATVPQPFPIGIVLIGTGLTLILRNSGWARRKYVRWQHRYPRAGRITDMGMRRRRKKAPLRAPVAVADEAPAPDLPADLPDVARSEARN
jgi:hypothetical protein